MNKLIIALAVISTNAMSAPVDCEAQAKVSHAIMEARQDGASKWQILTVSNSSNFKVRVNDAYNSNKHYSVERKEDAAVSFSKKHLNKCLSSQKL